MTTFRSSLQAAMPDTWFTKESITLLAPDGQANVIASTEPLDATVDTAAYAAVQGDLLQKEFPEYAEQDLHEEFLLGGRLCIVRRFSWTPPDGESVTQIQIYHAAGGRGYTATGTTPTAHFPEVDLQMQQILEGLRKNGLMATPSRAPGRRASTPPITKVHAGARLSEGARPGRTASDDSAGRQRDRIAVVRAARDTDT